MKYLACSGTQAVLTATLREYISANGLHRRCGIRKCRRDGQCTGPIYGVCRTTSELLLIDREEIEADSRIGALPVCAMSLNNEQVSAISEYLDGRRAQVEHQPGLTINVARPDHCGAEVVELRRHSAYASEGSAIPHSAGAS